MEKRSNSSAIFEAHPNLSSFLAHYTALDSLREQREEAISFLCALGQIDREEIDSHTFCFQIFTQIKAHNLPPGISHGLASHRTGSFTFNEKFLRRMNMPEHGAFCGVYVVVNETDGRGRLSSNVVDVRALFVELDHGSLSPEHIAEFIQNFSPSIVVESSPGKLHCYWLLQKHSLPLDKFERCQILLQRRFVNLRAGTQAKDLPRVLRVPGFLHLKDLSAPFVVKLHHCNPQAVYTPDEVFAAVQIDAEFVEKFRAAEPGIFQHRGNAIAPEIRDSIDPAYNEFLGSHQGNRNDSIYHYCLKHLFQHRGLNHMEGLAACILANQLNNPPLERDELETIVGSAWKKFQLAGGVSAPPPGLARQVFGEWTKEKSREEIPSDWLFPDGQQSFSEKQFEYDYHRIQMVCPISDTALVDRIYQRIGSRINYSPISGYYFYNDLIWANSHGAGERLLYQSMSEILADVPFERAVELCFQNSKGEIETAKLATFQKDIHSTHRLYAVSQLLSKRIEIETSTDQFNRAEDADVIACPNGILDLKLGRIVASDPKYRLTHIIGTDFDPSAACPTWEYFVSSAMDNDPDLISYLQKVTGYFLSGRTHLQCIFVAFGRPGTGKSVYLQVLAKLLAGYCSELHKSVLIAGSGSENAKMSSLAQAIHCRLGTVQELKASEIWDEAIVKAVSGNDPIMAKLSHKDTITFTPNFKVCVRANELPTVEQIDEGLWTRLKFLPFEVRFRGTEREDPFIIEKLYNELSGILTWAVAGYQALLREGLQEPELARVQRIEAQSEAEPVREFIVSCCEEVEHKAGLKSSEFQAAFENYCRDQGITARGKVRLRKLLINEYGYTEKNVRIDGIEYPVKRININLKQEYRSRYSLKSNIVSLRESI